MVKIDVFQGNKIFQGHESEIINCFIRSRNNLSYWYKSRYNIREFTYKKWFLNFNFWHEQISQLSQNFKNKKVPMHIDTFLHYVKQTEKKGKIYD